MPRKPKRPCSFPGCPKLTDGRFCEEHGKQENRRYEKYDRDPAVRRRYGRAWKRIRDRYAARHPFCEECYKKGLLRPVEEVHHKLPLAEGGTHDEGNLVSLCQSVVRQIICTYILHIKCACISDGMDKHSKFLHLFAQLI